MDSIVNVEIAKNQKFAEDNGLSYAMIEQEAEEIYNGLDPKDFDSNESRQIRALRRARGAFKRQAQQMGKAEEGMIVCRFRDYSFDRDQYNLAMSKKIKEGEDAAYEAGLINKDGKPIYRFGNKTGEVITKPSANGSAVGYLCKSDKDGEEVIETRHIAINDRLVDSTIPVCQNGRIAGSVGKSSAKDFPYSDDKTLWYNASTIDDQHRAPYSKEEMGVILSDWDKAFSKESDDFDGESTSLVSRVASHEELLDYALDHCLRKGSKDHQYDFCFVPGVISQIGVPETEYDDVFISIEFTDYYTNDVSYISTYLPAGQFKGLSVVEGAYGICVLQAYNFSDDDEKIRWHLGGFLHAKDDVRVEEFFGVTYD